MGEDSINILSNPGQGYVKTGRKPRLVTGYSCHPSRNASGDKPHPPSHYVRHPPPPQGAVGIHTTGAMNYGDSCQFCAVGIRPPRPGTVGIRPPRRLRRHPSAEGNLLRSRCGVSSPPLEGWAKPGVVRECRIRHLVPFVIARE